VLADGSTESRETTVRYANGDVRHAQYSVSAFRKPDGSAGGVVGVFVDIEPLKVAERALADSLGRQNAISRDHRRTDRPVPGPAVRAGQCEPRAYARLRARRDDRPVDADHVRGRSRVSHFGDRAYPALRRGEIFADEFRLVRKDGTRFWARITAAALDPSDPLKGTLGIYEDVTEAQTGRGGAETSA
jgi:PAS domain-containing protein